MQEQIQLNGKIYKANNVDEFIQQPLQVDTWQYAIYSFLKQWFDSSTTITVQTSGSTGQPKAIQLSKTAMRHSAQLTNNYFELQPDSTALLCMPASYIAGKMMLVRALVGGYNLLAVEPCANPFLHLKQIIHFTAITAYQFSHAINSINSNTIKNILIGGSSINYQTQELINTLAVNCYESYGMTETCSHIAIRPLNGPKKSAYFHTLAGIKIRNNEQGCLCIEAPHLLQAEIETNDLVEIVNPTSFKWLGRRDNIINSGGIKIQPEQVELKLASILKQPYFVSSTPDPKLGQKLILVIESQPLTAQIETELKTAFQTLLTKYEQPKEIYYLSRFCYSVTNKVLKKETLQLI